VKRMWAPWRIEYIREAKPEGCIFCAVPAQTHEHDAENLILHRGETAFVLINRYPYTNGHLMVVPYRHVDDPRDLTAAELGEIMALVNAAITALQSSMRPDGFNVGMNLGAAAGA